MSKTKNAYQLHLGHIGHCVHGNHNTLGDIIINIHTNTIIMKPQVQNFAKVILSSLFMPENESMTADSLGDAADKLILKGRMTHHDFFKLNNFSKVALYADELLCNESDIAQEYDFDWIMRFYESVGSTSNENLQKLWGKILAHEIMEPRSCSFRTLDIIHTLSADEAMAFDTLCKYVLHSGDDYFLLDTGFCTGYSSGEKCLKFMQKKGLLYEKDIIPLLECGLLSTINQLTSDFKMPIYNDKVACLIYTPQALDSNNEAQLFSEDVYFLTRSGVELYKIIKQMANFEVDTEYALMCFEHLKNKYPSFKVTAHNVDGDCPDTKIDLLSID